MERSSHFIRDLIGADLASGRHAGVVTRFPPEPNGFLHIGHAKAIGIDFGMAAEFGGRCHLRFDDTNPAKEESLYEEAIQADVRWLGYDWGPHLYNASDYFEALFGYGMELVDKGLAFVCDCTDEQVRERRGTVTTPGIPCGCRERSVAVNRDLFTRMRAGEFEENSKVLRGKIDLASPNMKMRDPLFYRIRKLHHHRTGDAWCIYPFYDFAHCLSDSLEGITHSLCSLEFDNNRELYDWILDHCDVPRPQPRQYEFAKLTLAYTLMSKRNLLKMVNDGVVSGWDDPRMPTLAAFRRRGVRPEAIRAFVERVGVSKAENLVDLALLEHVIREDLGPVSPRVMAVTDPLEVVITSWPEGEVDWVDASLWPQDVPDRSGSRKLPFSRRLWIERADFSDAPPKKWKRLAPGAEVRLRYGYWIRCVDVERDADGRVIRLLCTHDPATRGGDEPPDGRKVAGTLHWVSADHAVPAEFRFVERLFTVERPGGEDWASGINPRSLEVRHGWIEPSVTSDPADTRYQFERTGYFWRDPVDSRPDRLVFGRIVALKDGFTAVAAEAPAVPAPAPTPRRAEAAPAVRDAAVDPAVTAFAADHGISVGDAEVLAADPVARATFDAVRTHHRDARAAAAWVVNELPRVGLGRALAGARFDAAALAALLDLVAEGTLTVALARQVLEVLAAEGGDPRAIAASRGLSRLDDGAALAALVDQVLAAFPTEAARAKENPRVVGFFVGKVMQASGGRAAADRVQDLLRARLA